jgi:exonuclease 1
MGDFQKFGPYRFWGVVVCMGVAGLLKAVRKAGGTVQLSEYAGQKAGICGHSWLHQLGSWYAHEIVTMGVFDSVVRLFTDRCIALQQDHGICPVVVFDGASHPGKSGTDLERAARRIAAQAELEDVDLMDEDRRRLEAMALKIDRKLLRTLQVELDSHGIQWYQAPFEADAQLAHLSRAGLVDVVIGNDSDFLVLGCSEVLYDLQMAEGTAFSIKAADMFSFRKGDRKARLLNARPEQYRPQHRDCFAPTLITKLQVFYEALSSHLGATSAWEAQWPLECYQNNDFLGSVFTTIEED